MPSLVVVAEPCSTRLRCVSGNPCSRKPRLITVALPTRMHHTTTPRPARKRGTHVIDAVDFDVRRVSLAPQSAQAAPHVLDAPLDLLLRERAVGLARPGRGQVALEARGEPVDGGARERSVESETRTA